MPGCLGPHQLIQRRRWARGAFTLR
jgi:hypothetical protein